MVQTPLIRSKKILAHAKGQPCTLRFPGICNNNPETTVACHIRDQHKGMGIKASDYSVVFGCSDCHRHLDEGADQFLEVSGHVIRALQETWGILIRDGIIFVPQDTPIKPKSIKRKPKGSRSPIRNRERPKALPQHTASRPLIRKSERVES